jgi:hypothetical protein
MIFEKFLVETKLSSLGCWKRPSRCCPFCCELSLHFCRLTTRHPNFLFCFFYNKKNPLHANCHKSPLVTTLPQHTVKETNFLIFYKRNFYENSCRSNLFQVSRFFSYGHTSGYPFTVSTVHLFFERGKASFVSNCKSHKWLGRLFIKSNNFAASKSVFFDVRGFDRYMKQD